MELPTQHIRQRVLRPLRRGEFISLAIVLALAVGFGIMVASGVPLAYDYELFLAATQGDYTGYFYMPWALPVFTVFDALPFALSFAVWNVLNLLLLFMAVRMFGGSVPVVLLSYQSVYCLFYGQVVGVLAGAFALMWWALVARRYWLAGLALAVMCIKPQVGVPFGMALLLLAEMTWFHRFKVALVVLLIALGSVLLYPNFLEDVIYTALGTPPNDFGSVSLWRYVGPLALVLWVPTLFLRLSPGLRLIAVVATTALSLPYFQQTDLLLLFMLLPVRWPALSGNVGYLMVFIGWRALPLIVVAPLAGYGWVLREHFTRR
ncbi:MAG: glycosyltransferase 87 family protein [Chloroflexota bacterium]